MKNGEIEVFVCSNCGYEDSSFIPSGAKHISCKKKCKENEIECPHCHEVVKKNIVMMPFEPAMTLKEYLELLDFIMKNHSFSSLKGKMIKSISNTFDTRTNEIYHIKLDDKAFNKINENRHKNLMKWVMNYLNS